MATGEAQASLQRPIWEWSPGFMFLLVSGEELEIVEFQPSDASQDAKDEFSLDRRL